MSKGKSLGDCKTCGSEIVETVNDSQFGDGECNGCEYGRYKSQANLLVACESLVEMAQLVAANWENGNLDVAVQNLTAVATIAEMIVADTRQKCPQRRVEG